MIELRRTHAEIEENPRDVVFAKSTNGFGHLVEASVVKRDPVAEASQALTCHLEGGGIAIDTQEPHVGS